MPRGVLGAALQFSQGRIAARRENWLSARGEPSKFSSGPRPAQKIWATATRTCARVRCKLRHNLENTQEAFHWVPSTLTALYRATDGCRLCRAHVMFGNVGEALPAPRYDAKCWYTRISSFARLGRSRGKAAPICFAITAHCGTYNREISSLLWGRGNFV